MIGRFVLLWIGAVLLCWMLVAGVWGLGVATAGVYGRGEAHKQLQSAPYRIQAYDHFFNTCASIQGLEGTIDVLTVQVSQTTNERDKNIVQSSLAGTQSARHQAIAQYNADARKDYTLGQFRDSDLPYEIPDTNYPTEKEKTSCGFD